LPAVIVGLERLPTLKGENHPEAFGTNGAPATKLPPESPQPSLSKFERRYTPTDTDRLDEAEASHRIDAARRDEAQEPDLHSLQERLRMIGRIVDEKQSAIVKISYDGNTINFEYRDGEGEIHREEYSTLALYKLQQQYYSERRLTAEDAWQGVHW